MKKHSFTPVSILVFSICTIALFCSCLSSRANVLTGSVEDGKTENLSCTVLVYGCCGRNDVEETVVNDLIDAAYTGPSKEVNLVTQYNYGTNDKDLYYVSGTCLMCLKKECDTIEYLYDSELNYSKCRNSADSMRVMYVAINNKIKELVDNGVYSFEKIDGDKKVPLYRPKDIAAFIDRAAKLYPADRYMLNIAGHGGGWYTYDDPVFNTGGVAWDDNFRFGDGNDEPIPITAENLAAGINMSENAEKVQCIYLDACKMNRIENICEYATTPAYYTIASFQSTTGGEYDVLIDNLRSMDENTDEAFEWALSYAFEEAFKESDNDISIIDNEKMADVCESLKKIVPLIRKDYNKHPDTYNDIIGSVQSPDYDENDESVEWDNSCKDLSQLMYLLSRNREVSSAVSKVAAETYKAIKDAVIDTFYGTGVRIKEYAHTGVGILFSDEYLELSNNEMKGYRNSAFYRQSGWNKLFEILARDQE